MGGRFPTEIKVRAPFENLDGQLIAAGILFVVGWLGPLGLVAFLGAAGIVTGYAWSTQIPFAAELTHRAVVAGRPRGVRCGPARARHPEPRRGWCATERPRLANADREPLPSGSGELRSRA